MASPAGSGGGDEGVVEGVSAGVRAVGLDWEVLVGVAGLMVDEGVALGVGEGAPVALEVGWVV